MEFSSLLSSPKFTQKVHDLGYILRYIFSLGIYFLNIILKSALIEVHYIHSIDTIVFSIFKWGTEAQRV